MSNSSDGCTSPAVSSLASLSGEGEDQETGLEEDWAAVGGSGQATFERLKVLDPSDRVRELQTVIRDNSTSRGDFIFYADRLIRVMVEEGLNCLPSYKRTVVTPTGQEFEGEWFEKLNCAVSILRSGEAMEKGLRECCRSMRIGKILIRRDQDTKLPRVYYAKFPPQIDRRQILLLHPVLESGATAKEALNILKEHGVREEKVHVISLFATPRSVRSLLQDYPGVTILTSELHPCSPSHFGVTYFGSD
jgi:uracil phosphoribosyltransferase